MSRVSYVKYKKLPIMPLLLLESMSQNPDHNHEDIAIQQ